MSGALRIERSGGLLVQAPGIGDALLFPNQFSCLIQGLQHLRGRGSAHLELGNNGRRWLLAPPEEGLSFEKRDASVTCASTSN